MSIIQIHSNSESHSPLFTFSSQEEHIQALREVSYRLPGTLTTALVGMRFGFRAGIAAGSTVESLIQLGWDYYDGTELSSNRALSILGTSLNDTGRTAMSFAIGGKLRPLIANPIWRGIFANEAVGFAHTALDMGLVTTGVNRFTGSTVDLKWWDPLIWGVSGFVGGTFAPQLAHNWKATAGFEYLREMAEETVQQGTHLKQLTTANLMRTTFMASQELGTSGWHGVSRHSVETEHAPSLHQWITQHPVTIGLAGSGMVGAAIMAGLDGPLQLLSAAVVLPLVGMARQGNHLKSIYETSMGSVESQLTPEQLRFLQLTEDASPQLEWNSLFFDLRKQNSLEIDPSKPPADYTVAEWVEMIMRKTEWQINTTTPNPSWNVICAKATIKGFLKDLLSNATMREEGKRPVGSPFSTFEEFRGRHNNFWIFFDRNGLQPYTFRPVIIRFRLEHPELYRQISNHIKITKNRQLEEIESFLYEAYNIMLTYTDLYDVWDSAALRG